MTTYVLSFDGTGINIVIGEGVTLHNEASDFPGVNLGPHSNQWPTMLLALFQTWILNLGRNVVAQIEDDGNMSAWLVDQE
jgi:hypothetical protein